MSFIRVEDRLPSHPKLDGIPSAAGWLHVCALAYCAHALTDGFVPRQQVHKLTSDPPRVVDVAVAWLTATHPPCRNPLWHVVEGGYTIHDYADPVYGNPTQAGAARARENASRAGQASVEARRQRHGTAQPRTVSEQPVRAPFEQSPNAAFERRWNTVRTPSRHVTR